MCFDTTFFPLQWISTETVILSGLITSSHQWINCPMNWQSTYWYVKGRTLHGICEPACERELPSKLVFPRRQTKLRHTKTTIPLRVGEEQWIYTSTFRVSVYMHHYSPPLRGIVVYYSRVSPCTHLLTKNPSTLGGKFVFPRILRWSVPTLNIPTVRGQSTILQSAWQVPF